MQGLASVTCKDTEVAGIIASGEMELAKMLKQHARAGAMALVYDRQLERQAGMANLVEKMKKMESSMKEKYKIIADQKEAADNYHRETERSRTEIARLQRLLDEAKAGKDRVAETLQEQHEVMEALSTVRGAVISWLERHLNSVRYEAVMCFLELGAFKLKNKMIEMTARDQAFDNAVSQLQAMKVLAPEFDAKADWLNVLADAGLKALVPDTPDISVVRQEEFWQLVCPEYMEEKYGEEPKYVFPRAARILHKPLMLESAAKFAKWNRGIDAPRPLAEWSELHKKLIAEEKALEEEAKRQKRLEEAEKKGQEDGHQ